jgi:hypothetical protein
MRIRLKGINSKRKKLADGSFKTYYWAWKVGPVLRGQPGTPEFVASYNAAVATKVVPLRGTAVTRLARVECTEAEIATITGHSLRSVRDIHYLARDPALGDSAITKLERGTKAPD